MNVYTFKILGQPLFLPFCYIPKKLDSGKLEIEHCLFYYQKNIVLGSYKIFGRVAVCQKKLVSLSRYNMDCFIRKVYAYFIVLLYLRKCIYHMVNNRSVDSFSLDFGYSSVNLLWYGKNHRSFVLWKLNTHNLVPLFHTVNF